MPDRAGWVRQRRQQQQWGRARGPDRLRDRARRWARPFLLSTALMAVLVVLHGGKRMLGGDAVLGPRSSGLSGLSGRSTPGLETPPIIDCREVHGAADPCAFVRANCDDEAAGLLPYLEMYYCGGGGGGSDGLRAAASFAVLVAWLGLLFSTIGIAASDFFSVNLNTIARILGLSESLAGVTFLAFGNGSPDVFSTFAAMGSNSGSMAVGELIGAAGFITAVVAGSMALVREFRVSRRTFVRDILFFIAAVAFAMVFLADGRLVFWECCIMIAFYVFYVVTVVGWHWVSTRRRRRRLREAAARATALADDVEHAPYHDDDDGDPESNNTPDDDPDDGAPVGRRRRRRPSPDISALERGPRIAVQSVDSVLGRRDGAAAAAAATAATASPVLGASGSGILRPRHQRPRRNAQDDAEDAEERRNRHMAAEMHSSMRVSMPGGRRGTTSSTMATPIRPSLLGVLEFRSVLASLQRSGTVRLGPLDAHGRRRPQPPPAPAPAHAHAHAMARGHSMSIVDGPGAAAGGRSMPPPTAHPFLAAPATAGRGRTFSSGDLPVPRAARSADGAQYDDSTGMPPLLPSVASPPLPAALHLEIPGHIGTSSPALSPFPGYTESPLPSTPVAGPVGGMGPGHPGLSSRVSSFGLTSHPEEDENENDDDDDDDDVDDNDDAEEAEARRSVSATDTASYPGLEDADGIGGRLGLHSPRPVRWWPYRVLPPPHVLTRTFFPSLAGWREKTAWDRFVSLISAPTVFLLVLTLPVVEAEAEEEEDDDDDDEDGLLRDVVDDPIEAAYAEPPPEATNEWPPRGRDLLLPRPPPQEADASSSTAVSMRSASTGATGATDAYQDNPRDTYHDEEVPAIPSTLDNPLAKPQQGAAVAAVEVGAAATAATAATAAADPAPAGWQRWLVAVQLVTGPLFTVVVVWASTADELGARAGRVLGLLVCASLVGSAGLVGVLLTTTTATATTATGGHRGWDGLLCFLGFVISVAWISTVAGEVVGVLKAIGVIAGISEAILGLTVFAVGNSLGDLVADLTVARLGYPVMALSACFGGPMLNILLGVGIGGAWATTQAARDREHRHPGEPRHYAPYPIAVGSSLLVSAVTVLVTLVVLLVAVPANGWVMSRRIGLALIGLWTVSTVGNVVMEVTGLW